MRRILAALLAAAPLPAVAACPSVPEVAHLASAILDRRAAPAPPAGMSLADAACARDRLVAVLAQPWGDQEGWKVAPPVAPGTPPLVGALFHGTLRERVGETAPPQGPELPARFGTVPRVSAGLLLRIRDEGVNAAGEDPAALLRHVDAVMPFLDLSDRVHAPEVPWTPAVALSVNLGTRLGVVGEPVAAGGLGAVSVTLSSEGAEVARGTAGQPLAALAWLVRDLAAQGRRLRAGDHVAIAGLTPDIAATPGRWVARYEGLGPGPRDVAARLR